MNISKITKRILGCFLALMISIGAAPAQQIPGLDDPEFVTARDLWLSGEDRAGLEALGALARSGHIAAQILLSRIGNTSHLSQHIKDALPRKERIALFREEKGLSGRDWMQSAAEHHELAAALWPQINLKTSMEDRAQSADIMARYGEIKLALDATFSLLVMQDYDRVTPVIFAHAQTFGIYGRQQIGSILAHLQRTGAPMPTIAGVDTPERMAQLIEWLQSDLHRFALSGQVPRQSSPAEAWRLISEASTEVPDLRAFRFYCRLRCGQDLNQCLYQAIPQVAGAVSYPMPLASPAQSIISDRAYRASRRFVSDIDRLLEMSGGPVCQ